LAAAFDTSPELWMNLESASRLQLHKQDSNNVARRAKLHETAPVQEMIRRRWIAERPTVTDLEAEVDRVFGHELGVAARKSTPDETTTPAQKSWICPHTIQLQQFL